MSLLRQTLFTVCSLCSTTAFREVYREVYLLARHVIVDVIMCKGVLFLLLAIVPLDRVCECKISGQLKMNAKLASDTRQYVTKLRCNVVFVTACSSSHNP